MMKYGFLKLVLDESGTPRYLKTKKTLKMEIDQKI